MKSPKLRSFGLRNLLKCNICVKIAHQERNSFRQSILLLILAGILGPKVTVLLAEGEQEKIILERWRRLINRWAVWWASHKRDSRRRRIWEGESEDKHKHKLYFTSVRVPSEYLYFHSTWYVSGSVLSPHLISRRYYFYPRFTVVKTKAQKSWVSPIYF